MKELLKYKKQQHGFHMVTPSPWPLLTSFSLLAFVLSIIVYLHFWRDLGFTNIILSFFCILFCIYSWFSDVITEATFQGNHTIKVYKGLSFGMVLFITSEIMFFFCVFLSFFPFKFNTINFYWCDLASTRNWNIKSLRITVFEYNYFIVFRNNDNMGTS